MQQFLKPAVGAAGTEVVAAELLEEFLVTVDHAVAAADMGFGRESPLPFTCRLEKRSRLDVAALP